MKLIQQSIATGETATVRLYLLSCSRRRLRGSMP
jgi:hypothetical protein